MSARAVALRALQQLDQRRIDRIADGLGEPRLDAREQAFAWELAHGVVRNERFLDAALRCCAHRGLPKDPRLRAALRLGAYQLLLLSRVPARAAVHETVGLVRRNQPFANAILRKLAVLVEARAADAARPDLELALGPERTLALPSAQLVQPGEDALAVRHSLPDFLVRRWRRQHGDAAAAAIAAAASTVPAVFLRPCGGRDAAALAAALDGEGVRTTTVGGQLRWDGGGSPFATPSFHAGAFVAQDPTAVGAAEAVGAAPGMTIVDLCAAPGTKAALLAERVQPDGVVLAFDVDPGRRQRIVDNAQRLRLQRWLRVVEDPAALPAGSADAALADVPCSNTGVLGRRVEVRRRLGGDSFAQMAVVQTQILRQAIGCVRPGGRVVYSTCSIEPEENDGVVDAVLDGTVACTRRQLTLPAAGVCDGGFLAVLARGAAAIPDRRQPG